MGRENPHFTRMNVYAAADFSCPFFLFLLGSDVEKRKNPVCGFVTPLDGLEADAHRKPEVSE